MLIINFKFITLFFWFFVFLLFFSFFYYLPEKPRSGVFTGSTKSPLRHFHSWQKQEFKYYEIHPRAPKSTTFFENIDLWCSYALNWELWQHTKEIKDRVVQNFKHSVLPFNVKNGILIGEIYRSKNCTTNSFDLNDALNILT